MRKLLSLMFAALLLAGCGTAPEATMETVESSKLYPDVND